VLFEFTRYKNYSLYLLLKYTYIQGYLFQLHTSIIRPLPKNRSISDFFVQFGFQEFTMLKYYFLRCMVKLKLLELKWIFVYYNKSNYTEIHFNSNNFNLTIHRRQ